jgi:hypothetical protein
VGRNEHWAGTSLAFKTDGLTTHSASHWTLLYEGKENSERKRKRIVKEKERE